jgi:hypothetical protein
VKGVSIERVGELAFESEGILRICGAWALPDDVFALAENAEAIGRDFTTVASVIPASQKGMAGKVDLLALGHLDGWDFGGRRNLAKTDILEFDGSAF